ncbi:MAG: hypothetical protein JNM00_07550 [Flavobacteriales bacterium]|nr:hypothetical protein [Flavobacteriales bacterium]
MKNCISLIIIVLLQNLTCLLAQVQRDQDLVTLKNGYQVLGYVIEQQPGKLIKVYRPEVPDTLDVKLEEISKLNKIWVQTFSELEVQPDTTDSIVFGRFNNKKYIFQVTRLWQIKDIEQEARTGVGLGFAKNFNNRFTSGIACYFLQRQQTDPVYADDHYYAGNFSLMQYQFMLENHLRLSGANAQNGRVSVLLAVGGGYVVDRSYHTFNTTSDVLEVAYEKPTSGWMAQAGVVLRVNPDNQSGFMIEPGISYFPQTVKQYNGDPDRGGLYLGYRRDNNALLTIKLSYFF